MKLTYLLLLLASLIISASAEGYFALFFYPNAPVTLLQADLVIPPASNQPVGANPHAVWTGLQPANNVAVLQNVLVNTVGGPGQLWIEPLYCCSPKVSLTNPFQVTPGDRVQTQYALQGDGQWLTSWNDYPGSLHGSDVFNPASFAAQGPFNHAVFAIELPGPGVWDFGPVTWLNIVIGARTNDASWCSSARSYPDNLAYTVMEPWIYQQDGITYCFIGEIVFQHP